MAGEPEEVWLDHTLQVQTEYKKQLTFERGAQLYLCYTEGPDTQHWFVTDKQLTIDFHLLTGTGHVVVAHAYQESDFIISEQFQCDAEVLRRVNEVQGATNYSLALRNSEHVARYIYSGAWISFQMRRGGSLRAKFEKQMTKPVQNMINTKPKELEEKEIVSEEPLYPNIKSDYIQFRSYPALLWNGGRDSYNIVILGPTGSGKSSLINLLFNQTVAKAAPTAASVTRTVNYIEGTYVSSKELKKKSIKHGLEVDHKDSPHSPKMQINQTKMYSDGDKDLDEFGVKKFREKTTSQKVKDIGNSLEILELQLDKASTESAHEIRERMAVIHEKAILMHKKEVETIKDGEKKPIESVCVVDTIGLCDTLFQDQEVYQIIKSSVDSNITLIDRVVIVCSGRIEKPKADAIKLFLNWMNYPKYKDNFVFVYSKSDDMSEADKELSLVILSELLDVDINVEHFILDPHTGAQKSVKLFQAASFPPNAEFSVIERDLELLKTAIFTQPRTRIKQEMHLKDRNKFSSCSLL
eukprot:GFUD01011498.1.p1 GENE.GFUD01011498.1~~GFUD01011498.1.p1  ORF type:complete len:524 (+),score=119.24 GFUD01011498.1:69-1640(+)